MRKTSRSFFSRQTFITLPLYERSKKRRKEHLDIEEFFQDAHGILGALDSVANGPGVVENLPVVAALKGLVAEKVDVLVGDAVGLLGLVLEVLQAVGLVPAVGEDVEGDLAADGEASGMLVERSYLQEGEGESVCGGGRGL